MQRISLSQAAAGMVLAKPVVNEKGQTLVAEKTEITETLIGRLERFNISRITVEGHPVDMPGQKPPDPAKIRLEIDRAFIRIKDDPTMDRLREIVLRHRLAHADQVLAELAGDDTAEEKSSDGN
jgi:hypothetical protein